MSAEEGKSWSCPDCHANIDCSGTYSMAYAIGKHIRDHEQSARNAALADAKRNPAILQSQTRVAGLLTSFCSGSFAEEDEHVEKPPAPWDDATKLSEYDRTVLYCAHVLWHAGDDYPACKP